MFQQEIQNAKRRQELAEKKRQANEERIAISFTVKEDNDQENI